MSDEFGLALHRAVTVGLSLLTPEQVGAMTFIAATAGPAPCALVARLDWEPPQ